MRHLASLSVTAPFLAAIPVVDGSDLVGMITLDDVKRIASSDWDVTNVESLVGRTA